MESKEQVVHDFYLLSRIVSFLEDHFDLFHLSLVSKFHRQVVLDSVQRITCRRIDKLLEIPRVFPNLSTLNLSLVGKTISNDVFPFFISKLSNLQISQFRLSFRSTFGRERTLVAPLETLSQLRVLELEGCFLDDLIAKQIGKGCKLLQDITLKRTVGSLTNNGVNDLLLSSSFGLRRLCLHSNSSLKVDPMPVIMKCSTLTSLVLVKEFIFGTSMQKLSFPNFKLNSIRELRIPFNFTFHLNGFVGCFVRAIINAGSPLEIVELDLEASESNLITLSNCNTLQSLELVDLAVDKYHIGQFFSKNHKLIELGLYNPQPQARKAMAEKILFVEEARNGRDQNSENVNAVLDFFSMTHFEGFRYLFGFNQKFSNRVQYLQEIELTSAFQATSYEGLYKLFSICTLLQKVELLFPSHFRERKNPDPSLYRALEALAGCPNLEHLCAPLGNRILRQILSGVKGLRRLEVNGLIEDLTDEALLLLKENSPNLRQLSLTYECPIDGGITDRGLEYLSFCSQLQTLDLVPYNGNGSGFIHLEKRCLWLNLEEVQKKYPKLSSC